MTPARLLALAAVCLAAACAPAHEPAPLARATANAVQPTLPPSNYDLAAPGTVFVWRDLRTGEQKEEIVGEHKGRQMEATYDGKRSFAYVPDPWADEENTDVADIEPLFPLEVGKKVTFHRQPRAGRTFDTVEVVGTETITLPFGTVDTYVIETTSKLVSGSWIGTATAWYAPSLHWQVQWSIRDNDGDNRRRQLVAVKMKP
jgi:hypothetical protein